MSVDILATRIRGALAGKKVTEQRMFGGVCFMLNGNMALGASPNGLLVRVGKDGHEAALKRLGVRPMIQRGKPMAGYVYVNETGTGTDKALRDWVATALTHVATLPAKIKPAKPATPRRKSQGGRQ